MFKRKGARTRKAQSASKVRSKAARSRIAGHHQTRAKSKQARVLGGRGVRFEDATDDNAFGKRVIVVIIPLARRPGSWRAFEDQLAQFVAGPCCAD
jgi:hypothetical protein